MHANGHQRREQQHPRLAVVHPHGVNQAFQGPSDAGNSADRADDAAVADVGAHDDGQAHGADDRYDEGQFADPLDVGHGYCPKPRQQDRGRGHDEQDVQSDDAIDQDRGQGLGTVSGVFVPEHHGLDQIAADDAQGGQVEQIAPEADADGVGEAAGHVQRPDQIPPANERQQHGNSAEGPGGGQHAPLFRLLDKVGKHIALAAAS